jgi:hypothetical protein
MRLTHFATNCEPEKEPEGVWNENELGIYQLRDGFDIGSLTRMGLRPAQVHAIIPRVMTDIIRVSMLEL